MSQRTDSMAGASGDAWVISEGVAGAACRINALPNQVLTRAISFLGAREVVQTCLLSRRWRDLWRSVPRINASSDEFDSKARTEVACDLLFRKFINRFLMLRNPVALDEFRLQYKIPDGSSEVAESEDANLWIHHALQSNARFIEVSGCSDVLYLDPVVFAPKFCFVTSMLLTRVYLEPPFFKNLQTGCTVLERLVLRSCTIYDRDISSQTLKALTIDSDCRYTFEGQPSISIPSLIDLHFFPAEARIPLLENMESLVTASFAVGTDDDKVDDMRHFLKSLLSFDITDLEFDYRGQMLKMEKNSQWCQKFNNLTALTLGHWCLSADYVLEVFLQNCPNLVKLTVKSKECNCIISKLQGKEGALTCQNMEMLEIVCSEGDRNILEKLLVEGGITSWNVCIRRH